MTFRALAFAFCLFILTTPASASKGMAPFQPSDVPPTPDYGLKSNWLAFPAPESAHDVDIFWVYPTILSDNEHWLMTIDDADLRERAEHTLHTQASVFSSQANLYAPLYRQMNLHGLALPHEQQKVLMSYGMDDVWAAFNYYIKHYNNGRPFILAGHSQGSNVLTNLVLQHWGSTGQESQLVAAYLIGWSITQGNLQANPALSMCESADQINCIISYNTVAEGKQHDAPTIQTGAVVTNPLSWRTDGKLTPASFHAGALFFLPNGNTEKHIHYTSAQAVNGGLVVTPADTAPITNNAGIFPDGVYHAYDYSIFYENLRQNAARRISAFSRSH